MGFEFIFIGQPGHSYRLQVSTNLRDWQTLTNLVATPDPIPYRDSDAPAATQRFYRAVSP